MKKKHYVVCVLMLALFLSGYCITGEKASAAKVQPTEMSASTSETDVRSQTEELKYTTEFEFSEPSTEETEETISPTEMTETSEATEPTTEKKSRQAPTTEAPTAAATEEPTETTTEVPAETEPEPAQTYGGFSDADINRIASVVNGEVGSMCGTITVTYADGTTATVSGDTIRMMHACVVINQVRSPMFPATVSSCIRTYWSSAYDRSDYRSSSQWQACRQAVIDALNGGVYMPSNIFGATQDASFGNRYTGYHQYARIDWDTGYCSGTFYYYAYG